MGITRRGFLQGIGIGVAATTVPAIAIKTVEQAIKPVAKAAPSEAEFAKVLWPGIEKYYGEHFAQF